METDSRDFGHAGALCALHPDQRATRTCTRCGNFMCATCTEGGTQSSCPTCRQRTGVGTDFPLTRENWSFSALWELGFEAFKREWVMLSVAAFIFLAISLVAQALASILPALGAALENQPLTIGLNIGSFFIQNALQGIVGMGFMRLIIDVLQGNRANIGWMFSQVHKTGTYIGTLLVIALGALVIIGGLGAVMLLVLMPDSPFDFERLPDALSQGGVIILVGIMLVAAVPIAWLSLPLYLLQAELACDDHPSTLRVLRNCYAYARGERLSILGVSLANFLILMAGMLACCVGFIPGLALSSVLTVGMCLALRTGADTRG